jgi:hypothetical protein
MILGRRDSLFLRSQGYNCFLYSHAILNTFLDPWALCHLKDLQKKRLV